MKRIIIMPAFVLFTVLLFSACSDSSTKQSDTSISAKIDSTKLKNASVKYTCTMHPEVISDTPGSCPKCGMTMVIKEMNSKADMQHMQMDSAKK
ncbi:MAG: heavy metal-binding domain-containing protein [Bacteroidota bacterium]|nr:heavy metal-binding domain-containing protein [Bacteroidota bacterium]